MKTLFPYGAALGLILVGVVSADQTRSDQPPPATPSTTGPLVRVSDQPAKNTRDGRTTINGVVISMPSFAPATEPAPAASTSQPTAPSAPAQPPAPSGPVRSDGTIEVPLNTIGSGESLQHQREREAADCTFAQARAELAHRQAEQPITTDAFGYPLRGGYAPYYGGYGYSYPRGVLGPIGPISSTTTGFEGQLHGTALKNYSDAANAGTDVLGNMHQDAIRAFGRAAQPPIGPIVDRQQQVQRDIQKDAFKQPARKR